MQHLSSEWQRAQQGHPPALEALINQALQAKGWQVRVERHRRRLVIHCDSQSPITPAQWTRFIRSGLRRLPYRASDAVWLQGSNWHVVLHPATPVGRPWWAWVLAGVGGVSLLLGGWLAYRWPQEAPAVELTTPVPTPAPLLPVVTIKAVGDVILGTDFPSRRLHPQPQRLLQQVQPELAGADVVFGNLEAPLTTYPYTSKAPNHHSVFAFRMPPAYAYLLRDAGFTLFNLANNHTADFGDVGLQDTVRHLQAAGIQSLGHRRDIFYQTVRGVRLAWLGFSPYASHYSVLDLPKAQQLVQQARAQADLVVVSAHMGAEGTGALRTRDQNEVFFGEPRGNPIRFSRLMVDSGADLVLGHGPHVPRAMEVYRGKLIAYSLGNFIGYNTLSNQGEMGYSLILEIRLRADRRLIGARVIPIFITASGIPVPDRHRRTIRLLQTLNRQDVPGSEWVLAEDGVFRPSAHVQKPSQSGQRLPSTP